MASSESTGRIRVLVVGTLVMGCTPTTTPSREAAAPDVVASAPIDRDAKADLREAAQPSLRAGMSSLPREAWPCALVTDDPSSPAAARSVFRYGERTSCRIPRSLAAFGVHGCPDRIEHTVTEGASKTRTFEYDDKGRMIAFHGDVTLRYAWQDDRLVSVKREHGAFDVWKYRDDDAGIIAVDEDGHTREVLRLDGDRLVQSVERVNGNDNTTTLEWANERPTKLRDAVARTFLYECSAEMLRDSAAGVPIPDAEMAALPVDVRFASWAAAMAQHRRDCGAFPARRCELVADFDGDGEKDRAVKIRARRTRRAGIAIRWGAGGVSILGAGVDMRWLATDVHLEGVDLSWGLIEEDFDFIRWWRVVPRSDNGFFDAGPRAAVGGGPESPAPGATGAGIFVDSGEAAEVIYWDGARWRLLLLGF